MLKGFRTSKSIHQVINLAHSRSPTPLPFTDLQFISNSRSNLPRIPIPVRIYSQNQHILHPIIPLSHPTTIKHDKTPQKRRVRERERESKTYPAQTQPAPYSPSAAADVRQQSARSAASHLCASR